MPSVKGRCDPVPASCKFLRIWRYSAENGPQIPGGALAGFPPGWYTEARMKRTAENPLLRRRSFQIERRNPLCSVPNVENPSKTVP